MRVRPELALGLGIAWGALLASRGPLLVSSLRSGLRNLRLAMRAKPRFAVVAIGTKNKCKLAAVAQTLGACPSVARAHAIAAFPVASGVSEQPMGLDETARGASSRAEAAYAEAISSQASGGMASGEVLAIGIESGLYQPVTADGWYDVCVVSAYDGKEHRFGLSCSFEIPPAIMRFVLERKMDLSEACNAAGITDDPHLGEHGGLIGILSQQRVTRLDYTVQALQTALFFVDNQKWY